MDDERTRARVAAPIALRASVLALALAACHTIELPRPDVRVARRPIAATWTVDPASAALEVALHRHEAGLANRFTVRVGESFTAYAEAFLGAALEPGDDLVVRASIERFDVADGVARLDTRFVVGSADGAVRMDERYEVEGPARRPSPVDAEFGRTAPVVKEVERSLHGALVLTFRAFLADLDEQRESW
jgi:hypothetical protein